MKGSRRLTGAEFKRMMNASDARGKALLMIGCTTGLRISEILKLTMQHVSAARGPGRLWMDKKMMKGKRAGRAIFLSDQTKDFIRRWLRKKKRSKWLFPGLNGKSMSRMQAHRLFKRTAIKAGIDPEHVCTHSMRKKFAQDAYVRLNHNVSLVQVIMGHQDIRSTTKYLEACDENNLWNRFHKIR